MRKRRPQVTCRCPAYPFPHRVTGGYCNGQAWLTSYFWNERVCCEQCSLNNNNHCEAAAGGEPIRECQGYRDHLAGVWYGKSHPVEYGDAFA